MTKTVRHKYLSARGVSTIEFLLAMSVLAVLIIYLVIFSREISELDRATRAGDYIANNKSSIVPFVHADSSGKINLSLNQVPDALSSELIQAFEAVQGNNDSVLILTLKMNPQDCPSTYAPAGGLVPACYDSGGTKVPCCMKTVGNAAPVPCSSWAEADALKVKSTVCYPNFPAVGVMSIHGKTYTKVGDKLYSDSPNNTSKLQTPVYWYGGWGSGLMSWKNEPGPDQVSALKEGLVPDKVS